ncbi:hypothetical protein Tco_1570831 [Tanacetum coccineum]
MHEKLLQVKLQHVWSCRFLTSWILKVDDTKGGHDIKRRRKRCAKLCMTYIKAHRAGYATLSSLIESMGLPKGTMTRIYSLKDNKGYLVVQMSSWCELTFFLGLQVILNKGGIFRILWTSMRKYDVDVIFVQIHGYRFLMYLTAARTVIKFARNHPFDLERILDSDYGGVHLERKSQTQQDLLSSGFSSRFQTIRDKLQLADATGITMLPNDEIFEADGANGSKSGGWDQFGSNIATALICQELMLLAQSKPSHIQLQSRLHLLLQYNPPPQSLPPFLHPTPTISCHLYLPPTPIPETRMFRIS